MLCDMANKSLLPHHPNNTQLSCAVPCALTFLWSTMLMQPLSLRSYTFPSSSFSATQIPTNPTLVPFKSSKLRNLSRFLCLSSGEVGRGDALIIVDHGSRRKESNLMLNEFVEMFKHKTAYEIVEAAHMELAEPSIRDAFQSCVQQGASRVIISPFFLSPGRHWSQDIPSLSAEAAKEHPGVTYIVTAPLGLHELLVDVVNDRIKHCLKHVAGDAEECSVCVGTGKCRLY